MKKIGLLFALLFIMQNTFAQNTSVPFENVIVGVNGTINANYSFGPNAIIFCYSDQSQNVTGTANITWPYKGKTQSGTLPITLVTNTNFQGQLADNSGSIHIQNTLPESSNINCVFAY